MPVMRQPTAGAWSESVNGLAGRLRLQFEDLRPGLRCAVYLDLRNLLPVPVEVINQPEIRAYLRDRVGRPVDASALVMSGPVPYAHWAMIPSESTLAIRVDMQTAGVPTGEQGRALIALGGKAWEVGAGQYVLSVDLVFPAHPDGPAHQWVGHMDLPPVAIVMD